MTRVFLVAGESSGDIHGASLVRALKDSTPSVACEGIGGRHMADAGMALHYDLAGQAIMGFTEVVKSLGRIRQVFRETAARLEQARPDCLVLIDYPGFNLQLARRAKGMGIPIVYYISPQVWAWKKGRIRTLAALVDKMLVILPFEESIYTKAGVDCTYVGHPLLDHIAFTPLSGAFGEGLVIGLLPGSREQEISRILATMVDVARAIREKHPEARFVTPCVDHAREQQVRAIAGDFPVETVMGKTCDLLDGARFCMVASGTATVEAALFKVPMVILYKVSEFTYWIARHLVNVPHIGMVNILAGRGIIPEFIQDEARPERVLPVALELIDDTPRRAQMLEDLAAVRASLGEAGASQRAASEVLTVIRRRGHG